MECEQTACHGRTCVEAILASPPHTTGPLGADRFAGCRLAPSHAVGAEQAQPELVEEGARLVGCEEGVERVSTVARVARGAVLARKFRIVLTTVLAFTLLSF